MPFRTAPRMVQFQLAFSGKRISVWAELDKCVGHLNGTLKCRDVSRAEDGGWLELQPFLATFDSSASSRSHSVNTRPSSSPRVRAERSGGVRFFAIANMMSRLGKVYNCFLNRSR